MAKYFQVTCSQGEVNPPTLLLKCPGPAWFEQLMQGVRERIPSLPDTFCFCMKKDGNSITIVKPVDLDVLLEYAPRDRYIFEIKPWPQNPQIKQQHPENTQSPNQSQNQTRHAARCDVCMKSIVGVRYKCANCPDYDLCASCEVNNTHNKDHLFLKCDVPINRSSRPLLPILALPYSPRTDSRHPCVLKPMEPYNGCYRCDVCGSSGRGISYHCEEHKWDVHPACVRLGSPRTSPVVPPPPPVASSRASPVPPPPVASSRPSTVPPPPVASSRTGVPCRGRPGPLSQLRRPLFAQFLEKEEEQKEEEARPVQLPLPVPAAVPVAVARPIEVVECPLPPVPELLEIPAAVPVPVKVEKVPVELPVVVQAPAEVAPPAKVEDVVLYPEQVEQLVAMGFDRGVADVVTALRLGNLERCLEDLIGNN